MALAAREWNKDAEYMAPRRNIHLPAGLKFIAMSIMASWYFDLHTSREERVTRRHKECCDKFITDGSLRNM
jgi:hypothetical protein